MKRPSLLLALMLGSLSPALAQNAPAPTAASSAVPITITASQGVNWSQKAQTVTALGNATAVRGNITITANQLVAHYTKKPGAKATSASAGDEMGQGESQLTQIDAIGNVHIFNANDNAWGDKAVYDMGQQVLVITGQNLKLTTPDDVLTARDSIEYYAGDHKAIARGDAHIVAKDGRSISADVIVGYFAAPAPGQKPADKAQAGSSMLDASGNLQRVEALGHVIIKTQSETVTGNRGVYLPPSGKARLGGDVHITHGDNKLSGSDALVDMKTNTATMIATPGGQVSGVVIPGSGKK